MDKKFDDIFKIYEAIKEDIIQRLDYFKSLFNKNDEEIIFEELIFCILTPQSKARMAEKCVINLKKENLIFSNDVKSIADRLNLVRFKNNKASYIVEIKKKLTVKGKISIIEKINIQDLLETRDNLVDLVKGYGYKEASHFLRNIGFGENLAILDRHILKNLKLFDAIEDIPKTLGRKKYLEIEDKMREFSKKISIPLSHLDFVFWYKEAGEIFK